MFLLFFFCLNFWDRLLLYSPVWFDTDCVGQAVLNLSEILLSLSKARITGMYHQMQPKMINFMTSMPNQSPAQCSTPVVPATRAETDRLGAQEFMAWVYHVHKAVVVRLRRGLLTSQVQGLTSLPEKGSESHRWEALKVITPVLMVPGPHLLRTLGSSPWAWACSSVESPCLGRVRPRVQWPAPETKPNKNRSPKSIGT